MNYRSPVLSLERELETLEAELAALRALAPAQPRPARTISKKARGVALRETQSLRAQLKKIKKKIDERAALVGVRDLTTRELASGKSMRLFGTGSLVLAALALGVTLGIAVHQRGVWMETTCSFSEDSEGDWIASYTASDGTRQLFGASRDHTGPTRCWVPGPTGVSHMGHFSKPTRPGIPLRERLSDFGLISAAIFVILGFFVFLANYFDERKRRNCEIEPDYFDPSD